MTKKLKKPKKSLENLLSEHASLILDALKNKNNNHVKEPIQIPAVKPQYETQDNLQILNSFILNLRKIKEMKLDDEISQYSVKLEDKIFELCELYNKFTNILGNHYILRLETCPQQSTQVNNSS